MGDKDLTSQLSKCWGISRDFYTPDKVGAAAKMALGIASQRLAFAIYVAAGLLTFALAFLSTVESAYLANFASEMVSEVSGLPQPRLEASEILSFGLFQFLFTVPFGILATVFFELIAYSVFRITGGKGTLDQQLTVSSAIFLSLSFTGVLSFFLPLPCLQVVAGLLMVLALIYILFYVTPKSYMVVHDVTMVHALAVILLVGVPRIALIYLAPGLLAGYLGLPNMIGVEGV